MSLCTDDHDPLFFLGLDQTPQPPETAEVQKPPLKWDKLPDGLHDFVQQYKAADKWCRDNDEWPPLLPDTKDVYHKWGAAAEEEFEELVDLWHASDKLREQALRIKADEDRTDAELAQENGEHTRAVQLKIAAKDAIEEIKDRRIARRHVPYMRKSNFRCY